MQIIKTQGNKNKTTEDNFLKKYVFQKIFWSIIALILVVIINILINKYAENYFNDFAQKVSGNYMLTGFSFFISEILIGIFPAELFMMIYQSKVTSDYFLIVFVLGIISSLCGFIAFMGGRYLKLAKFSSMILFKKKIKEYCALFVKYGWVILTLAATTPLPFAMVCFIAGYLKFSPVTFLKIVVPVRIVRFFISAFLIKYSIDYI
ncbi:VTT domain-containing protein [Flavobacterium sp.]|uniref:VTT domain-containing protein n=1 Tax=Flavobacterium sp. TaxID=239 RepID=UPI003750EA0B